MTTEDTAKLELFNKAMSHLASKSITSLSSTTSVQLAVLNRVWDSARKQVLSEKDWPCATVIESLELATTGTGPTLADYVPPANWEYGYSYPSSCVAFWKVYNQSVGSGVLPIDNDFTIVGLNQTLLDEVKKRAKVGDPFRVIYDADSDQKIILTNTADALGEYTYDLDTVALYTPSLFSVMVLRLALEAAPSLTADNTIIDGLNKRYQIALSEAQRVTGYESADNAPGDSGLIDARG